MNGMVSQSPVDFGLAIAAVLLGLPCYILAIEVVMALFGKSRRAGSSSGWQAVNKRAVLMPAHNEAAVIQTTLETLMPQLRSDDTVLVVADNCDDNTAELARQAGATVVERRNEQQRGKGYALDYGVGWLEENGVPDVVVLIDADCRVFPGTVDKISTLALETHRPVQATYLLEQNAEPSPKEIISTFAFKVKNLVRPLGLKVLGQPCLLTGTGMAFPWDTIRQADLASGNIVEDMKLGLDLAVAGHPPLLCADALVTGEQPQQDETSMTQRTRWEHGHLQTLLTCVPPLLGQGLRQRRIGLIALALDLCVPPLSLLVMLWIAGTGLVTAITLLLQLPWLAATILYSAGVSLFTAIVIAWLGFAREDISLKQLLSIPLYVLWKIPLYFKFLKGPEAEWIRTDRGR